MILNRQKLPSSYALILSDSGSFDQHFATLTFPEYNCQDEEYKGHYAGDIVYRGFVRCIGAKEFMNMLSNATDSYIAFPTKFSVRSIYDDLYELQVQLRKP